MGNRVRSITRRIKRLFKREEAVRPKKMAASQVIRPEQVIPLSGKPAPKTTRRHRTPGAESEPSRLNITVLQSGVTHIIFPTELPSVPVRDPVTRRLSRKQLSAGMTKMTNYYDERGRLISDQDARW